MRTYALNFFSAMLLNKTTGFFPYPLKENRS